MGINEKEQKFCKSPNLKKNLYTSFKVEGLFVLHPVGPRLRLGLQSLGLPQKDSLLLYAYYASRDN
jgi:hypothetical protein